MASLEGDNEDGETEMPFGFARGQAGGVQGFRFLNCPNTQPPRGQKARETGTVIIHIGCSRFLCLFLVGNVFHQVCGLTVQNGANLV